MACARVAVRLPASPVGVCPRLPQLSSCKPRQAVVAGANEASKQAQGRRGKVSWPAFLSSLFVSGAVFGPLMDGIHTRVGLTNYVMFTADLGSFHTCLAVPPLLGLFYVVLGSLFVLADEQLPGPETKQVQQRVSNLGFVAAAAGVLAADHQLSAALFATGTPYEQISVALALAAALTWKLFDGTPQGVGLAAFCAVGAPLSELVLLRLVPMWNYPAADWDLGAWGGFVSWVPWCYFFYTPVLGAWARHLWQTCRKEPGLE